MKHSGKSSWQGITIKRNCRDNLSRSFKNYGNLISKYMNKIIIAFALLFSLTANSQVTIEKWKMSDLEAAMKNADKPTVINFWATFCKPCLEELPYFQELAKKYQKNGVRLILVNLDMPSAYPKKISDF